MVWLPYETKLKLADLTAPVLGVASDFGKHDSKMHHHQHGQLLFIQQGSIHIISQARLSILSPRRVAWIPPLMVHRVIMHNSVDYRSIYIDAQVYPSVPQKMTIYDSNPLIQAVLEQIAFMPFATDWQRGDPYHLLALCLSWLTTPPTHQMSLPLPQNKRLAPLCTQIETLPPKLSQLAAQIGAAEKTVSRLFKSEVGMDYQQWRQRWRFIKAVELLNAHCRNSEIAAQLEFSSDSAFAAFFKQWSGETPQKFVRQREK